MAAVVLAALLGFAWAPPAPAAFPGGNGKIIFVRDTGFSSEATELFTIDPDGLNETQLTDNTWTDDAPAWSADGSKIAFRSDNSIWVMRSDGSGWTQLTRFRSAGSPAWSPDGGRIAFTDSTSGRFVIYTMRSDGSDPQVFSDMDDDTQAAWSPDGTEIAFSSDFPGFGPTRDIYSKSADGQAGAVNLTDSAFVDASPDWSPDGSMIVFNSARTGNGDVYVMDRDGANERRLTFDPSNDQEAVWSPDGSKIVFSSNRDGNDEIYVMNPDGSDQTRITSNSVEDSQPDWQALPNRPPDCSDVTALPQALWPPNRRFRTVSLSGATDPDGDAVSIAVDGVTQDERVGAQPDARLSGDATLRVRAESDRRGDGRVYTIAFTATDDRGGSCSGTTSVEVRKHKHRPAVDSSPPSYDSLGGS